MSKTISGNSFDGISICGDVQIGTFGLHDTMNIETPVFLGQGSYDIGAIGAFTQINMRAEYDKTVYSCIECTSIGRYCSISHGVNIGLPGHAADFLSTSTLFKYNNRSEEFFLPYISKRNKTWETEMKKKNIEKWKKPLPIIENDVWIGYGVTILNGVKIGNGAIIAANAVVTKDVLPYTIVAGNPARFIRTRFTQEIIEELIDMEWWEYNPDLIVGLPIDQVDICLPLLKERLNGQEKWKPSVTSINI